MRKIVRYFLALLALLAGCSQPARTSAASTAPSITASASSINQASIPTKPARNTSTARLRLTQAKAEGFTVLGCPSGTSTTELSDGDNHTPGGTTIFDYVARRYPDLTHYFETLHLLVNVSARDRHIMVYVSGFKEGQRAANDVEVTDKFVDRPEAEFNVSLDGATYKDYGGSAVIATFCSGP